MTIFQIIMLGASAYFAFRIYEHIQTLQDPYPESDDSQPSSFDPKVLVEKANEAFEEGDLQRSLALFLEADAKEPQDGEILFKTGYILENLGDKNEALNYYKRALDKDSANEYIHNSIASIYRANEEFASAKMHLNASLDINDKNPITYYNYGNLLVDMKHIDEAKEMYKKAVEIDPDFKQAQEELKKLA
mgnify:CR=1 FL=1